MIKIFVTDMDQTFLDNESQLPDRTQDIIDLLASKDKMFIVASGRALSNLEHKFKDINHNISFISDNGAILKHKGEVLYKNTIDPQHVRETIKVLESLKNSSIVVIKMDNAYVLNPKEGHMAKLQEYYTEIEVVDDLSDYVDDVIKITTISLEDSHYNYKTFVEGNIHPELHAVESGIEWIDITNKGINKGNAIQILLDKYNINTDQLVTFGDYFNDLEMIKLAKYGYVVENGAEGLKEHAYEVIGKNTDDAVINKILEHLE